MHDQNPTPGAGPAPAKTVAELEAELADAKQAEAADAAQPAPVTLESLDARVTDLERMLRGGAVE